MPGASGVAEWRTLSRSTCAI